MQRYFFKVSFFRVEIFVHTIFLIFIFPYLRAGTLEMKNSCQSYLITFSHIINQTFLLPLPLS